MMFRVKQIGKDVYIPQVRRYWITKWESIDRTSNYTYLTDTWSQFSTLTEATDRVNRFKEYLNEEKKYPKYYKV